MYKHIIPGFVIIIFAYFLTFIPVFSLGLFGDDWMTIYRYKQYLEFSNTGFNHLTYFLTSYGPQDILMGILEKAYGWYGPYYHFTSFVLRLFAGLSLFIPMRYITKSNFASLFSILFFLVTPIGLDTTNWVFNMPSYISIVFLNLFLYTYIRFHLENDYKYFWYSLILFYLTFVFQPLRMHGLFPFVVAVETFQILKRRQKSYMYPSIVRMVSFGVILSIIYFSGLNRSPVGVPMTTGLKNNMILNSLMQRDLDFVILPVTVLGNMLVPESYTSYFNVSNISPLQLSIVISFIYIVVLLVFKAHVDILKNKSYRLLTELFFIGNIVANFIISFSTETVQKNYLVPFFIGFFFCILLLYLMIILYKNNHIMFFIYISFVWALVSFLPSWVWGFTGFISTTHRYLIVSSVGVSIMVGILFSLAKEKGAQISFSIWFIFFILIHALSANSYLQNARQRHNVRLTETIWTSMIDIHGVKDTSPLVFYFNTDSMNSGILEDVVTFGFPPHMGLLYDIRDGYKLPVPLTEWDDIVKATTTGENMTAYSYTGVAVPLTQIYSFTLTENGQMINTTKDTREKLKKL